MRETDPGTTTCIASTLSTMDFTWTVHRKRGGDGVLRPRTFHEPVFLEWKGGMGRLGAIPRRLLETISDPHFH